MVLLKIKYLLIVGANVWEFMPWFYCLFILLFISALWEELEMYIL